MDFYIAYFNPELIDTGEIPILDQNELLSYLRNNFSEIRDMVEFYTPENFVAAFNMEECPDLGAICIVLSEEYQKFINTPKS